MKLWRNPIFVYFLLFSSFTRADSFDVFFIADYMEEYEPTSFNNAQIKVNGISRDGQVVFGDFSRRGTFVAKDSFFWNKNDGFSVLRCPETDYGDVVPTNGNQERCSVLSSNQDGTLFFGQNERASEYALSEDVWIAPLKWGVNSPFPETPITQNESNPFGLPSILGNFISDASDDGETLIGYVEGNNPEWSAYRWSRALGYQPLNPSPEFDLSLAIASSSDGKVVIGVETLDRQTLQSISLSQLEGRLLGQAFVWTENSGKNILETSTAGGSYGTKVVDISKNGKTIIGSVFTNYSNAFFFGDIAGRSSVTGSLPYIWNDGVGMLELPSDVAAFSQNIEVVPQTVSADGTVIFGHWKTNLNSAGSVPEVFQRMVRRVDSFGKRSGVFMWTETIGFVDFQDYLLEQSPDLLSDYPDIEVARGQWFFSEVTGVSDDCTTITGNLGTRAWALLKLDISLCEEPVEQEEESKPVVFFVNGIMTDHRGVALNASELQFAIDRDSGENSALRDIPVFYVHNPSINFFTDLAEVAEQKLKERGVDIESFLVAPVAAVTGVVSAVFSRAKDDVTKALAYFSGQTLEVKDTILEAFSGLITTLPRSDIVEIHLNTILDNSIDQGKGLIVVSHSQGNLFANEYYNSMTDDEKLDTHVIHIATPTNVLSGLNYTTDDGDLIIAPLSLAGLARPSNIDNDLDESSGCEGGFWTELAGHNFINCYMADGSNTKNKVLTEIKSSIELLAR